MVVVGEVESGVGERSRATDGLAEHQHIKKRLTATGTFTSGSQHNRHENEETKGKKDIQLQ